MSHEIPLWKSVHGPFHETNDRLGVAALLFDECHHFGLSSNNRYLKTVAVEVGQGDLWYSPAGTLGQPVGWQSENAPELYDNSDKGQRNFVQHGLCSTPRLTLIIGFLGL